MHRKGMSLMEKHCAKIKAVYWQGNGKRRYDMWQQKEVNDKDRIDIEILMDYIIYSEENRSNYREVLISKITELDSKMPGLTHLEVWENGFLLNIFRVTKSPSGNEYRNWNEIIEALKKPDSF
ncbi:hypothetical protein [Clostridium paraputrificum]|uniref:hypothetical protein n=1 Tax=Clostridium paraputrificum TaxID=29363 RepID=UPI0018A036A7|nr:hypothetical protein [Clostridium paraputrificum]